MSAKYSIVRTPAGVGSASTTTSSVVAEIPTGTMTSSMRRGPPIVAGRPPAARQTLPATIESCWTPKYENHFPVALRRLHLRQPYLGCSVKQRCRSLYEARIPVSPC